MTEGMIEEVVPAETVKPFRDLEVYCSLDDEWRSLWRVKHETEHVSTYSRVEVKNHAYAAHHQTSPRRVTFYFDSWGNAVYRASEEVRIRRRMRSYDEYKVAEFGHPAAQEVEVGEEL